MRSSDGVPLEHAASAATVRIMPAAAAARVYFECIAFLFLWVDQAAGDRIREG